MGEINYTLLNASVLNASRLNMTGETGKPGGGAGGYWPDGTPAAIRKSSVLWYDIAKQGATNENLAEHPYLKDLTGNGHDMELRNFAWTEESGISTENYPGALVSDGVDDYGYVEGLPLLTKERGYTIIAKREWLTDIVRSVGFLSSKNSSENGAFCFECSSSTVKKTVTFGKDNRTTFAENKVVWQTKDNYNGTLQLTVGDKEGIDSIAIFRQYVNLDNFYGDIAFYSLLLFDRDLTAEEIEWVKANIMAEPEPTPELDASLVDAWVFSGYRNEDAPATVTGERGRELSLRNFGYTAGSGFDGGCLVTDGVDDYGICADFPIKDTYTLIMKFATLNGKWDSAACTTTYFEDSGTRRNGIFPIYIAPNVPYASMMGRRKNVAASSELAVVWMNKEAFCGEAYDDTSALYTPSEGQECTVYVGRLDDRGFPGGYKLAYLAYYDKVMTAEEVEAEVAKLDALWEARKV